MKLSAVIAVLGACGTNGAAPGDGGSCTPFSVVAPGNQGEVQPVWAGDSWAIARAGVYARVDDAGTVTEAALPDLPMESFAYDGVELGYYVPSTPPHIALFTPGDVSTLHASPSFGTMTQPSATGSVRADPTGAPRIEAFYTDFGAKGAARGWSDGAWTAPVHEQSFAEALAPTNRDEVYAQLGGLGEPAPFALALVNGSTINLGTRPDTSSDPVQMIASDRVAIIRHWGTWKIAPGNGGTTPIESPPLAWSGDAFVTFDQGALQLYDRDYTPLPSRPLDVPDTVLLGVGATPDRALLVFASAASSTDVRYVQVCF